MSLSKSDVVALVNDQLRPGFDEERKRLDGIALWYRHRPPIVNLPRKATPEIRALAELSRTPWLGLIVSVLSQATYVDGYRSPNVSVNAAGPWRTWVGNDLDARQVAINRAAFAYGYAFARVLPGTAPDGSPMSRIRGVSPRNMQAFYTDPAEDDWAKFVVQIDKGPNNTERVEVFDEEFVYYLGDEGTGDGLRYISQAAHGATVPPVVRFANQLDLEGNADGEVEPFIPIAARINKTDFDRLLAQHFASWRTIYATGMAMPEDEEAANIAAAQQKLRLRQDDVLIAEDKDTRFGTLDASPLDGLISARKADIESLAASSQTPTSALTGDLINLSAEALASARAQLDQKLAERKTSLGRSYAQSLRLAALLEGDTDSANDVEARVTWQDMSIRSMSQAVDALGKAATMLNVPVEALWSRIPGVTQDDVTEWKREARQAAAKAAVTNLAAAAQAAKAANPAVADLAAQRGAA